jgi:hypothetical protein
MTSARTHDFDSLSTPRGLQRLRAALRRHGWRGLLGRALPRLGNSARDLVHELFYRRNHVYQLDWNLPFVPSPPGFRVERYAGSGALSAELRGAVLRTLGPERLVGDLREMKHAAVLWVGYLDGELAGLSMTRRGAHFRRWFVPLNPEDIVVIRNQTAPTFRGRNVCPALMRRAIAEELKSGGTAYCDCRVYNHASIRSIEKAGLRRIATCRPLSRAEALDE